tara:strand:+ start:2454 stop:3191 length:738 start_codon:yes stop_codon:yes gene_type:complete
MKTLIGSVFSGTGKPQLLDLQLSFISQNTKNAFEHVSYLTENANPNEYTHYPNSTIIGQNSELHVDPSKSHLNGLLGLLSYFRSQQDQYDMFAVLDSDCFPIAEKWDQTCYSWLTEYPIISCIRTENLDTFLHPCICVFKNPNLLDFQRCKNKNLLNQTTSDNQVVPLDCSYFPLIRTNNQNHHPILAAIYGNMFYHHGCGSRSQVFRSNPYYDKLSISNHDETAQQLLKKLFEDPNDYIHHLGG